MTSLEQLKALRSVLDDAVNIYAQNSLLLSENARLLARIAELEKVSVPVPSQPKDARLYGIHWMGAFRGIESPTQTVARARNYGQRIMWEHCERPRQSVNDTDSSRNNYTLYLRELLDAAAQTSDFRIVPGWHGNWPDAVDKHVICTFYNDFFEHPGVFRLQGRPVFAAYDYRENRHGLVEYLAKNGYPKDSYWLWVYQEPTNKERTWPNLTTWLLDHPEVDGFINFAVNVGAPHGSDEAVDKIIARNDAIRSACAVTGRTSIGGWSGRYGKGRFNRLQVERQWKALVERPPDYVFGATGNDIGEEQSYVNDLGSDKVSGGSRVLIEQREVLVDVDSVFLPPRGTFRFGKNVPFPCPQQQYYSEWALPFVKEYSKL